MFLIKKIKKIIFTTSALSPLGLVISCGLPGFDFNSHGEKIDFNDFAEISQSDFDQELAKISNLNSGLTVEQITSLLDGPEKEFSASALKINSAIWEISPNFDVTFKIHNRVLTKENSLRFEVVLTPLSVSKNFFWEIDKFLNHKLISIYFTNEVKEPKFELNTKKLFGDEHAKLDAKQDNHGTLSILVNTKVVAEDIENLIGIDNKKLQVKYEWNNQTFKSELPGNYQLKATVVSQDLLSLEFVLDVEVYAWDLAIEFNTTNKINDRFPILNNDHSGSLIIDQGFKINKAMVENLFSIKNIKDSKAELKFNYQVWEENESGGLQTNMPTTYSLVVESSSKNQASQFFRLKIIVVDKLVDKHFSIWMNPNYLPYDVRPSLIYKQNGLKEDHVFYHLDLPLGSKSIQKDLIEDSFDFEDWSSNYPFHFKWNKPLSQELGFYYLEVSAENEFHQSFTYHLEINVYDDEGPEIFYKYNNDNLPAIFEGCHFSSYDEPRFYIPRHSKVTAEDIYNLIGAHDKIDGEITTFSFTGLEKFTTEIGIYYEKTYVLQVSAWDKSSNKSKESFSIIVS